MRFMGFMEYNDLNLQFITCPVCKGIGINKKDDCKECNNLGLGVFALNRFFYWKPKFNIKIVKFNRFQRFIGKIFILSLYLIAFIGIASFVFWIIKSGNSKLLLNTGPIVFVKSGHIEFLLFWLGILSAMFIYYNSSRAKLIHRIDKKNKKVVKQNPNNWNELRRVNKHFKVDVANGFSVSTLKVIERSFLIAHKAGHSKIDITHLFLSLLEESIVKSFFQRLNIDQSKLKAKLLNQLSLLHDIELPNNSSGLVNASINKDNLIDPHSKVDYNPNLIQSQTTKNSSKAVKSSVKRNQVVTMSNNAKKALIETYLRVFMLDGRQVKPLNLLLSFEIYDKNVSEILYDLEVDREKIINCLEWFRINRKINERKKLYSKMAKFKPGGTMDRAYTAVETTILNHFSYDVTRDAKWGILDFCVNREKEIKNVFENFISGQVGCLLVGEVGVGKDTIVSGIAQLMVEEKVPRIIRDKRLLRLDVSRLVSGASISEVQERLLVMIDEINRAGNIILYIDDIENIVGIQIGTGESLDLSEVLAGAIERRALYCIASTTPENYTKYIEGRAIGDAMAKVIVNEPDRSKSIQIIESKVGKLEQKYQIYFSYNALERIVYLSDKYIKNKYLPQKAVKILENIAVKIAGSKGKNSVVSKEDVGAAISEITGIPVTKIGEDESKKLLNLEKEIHNRMVNQEEAVNGVAASLRRARVELREGKRPIASFLFLGPTGVGKTELAKTISEIYFGNEDNMIRLDMSEYQHVDSVKKMIGGVDGTLGYLTEAVRKTPFALVLLDEFEKAHPKIMDLFLQVMDDGRLTDGQGRTIDFTNCIIISTSNIGSVYIQEQVSIKTDIEVIKKTLINEHINKVLRPELINRYDGVIVFKPLTFNNVIDIAKLMLRGIGKVLNPKGIVLKFTDKGVAELAKLGFDPAFGARPLRRLLQQRVENVIADKILTGELKRRDIAVINKEGNIEVEKGREL